MLEKKEERTEVLNIRLTPIEKRELKALSDEFNIPKSEIARKGIRYISNQQAEKRNNNPKYNISLK